MTPTGAAARFIDCCHNSLSGEPQIGWDVLNAVVAVEQLDLLHAGRDFRVACRLVRFRHGSTMRLYSLSVAVEGGYTFDVADELRKLALPESAAGLLV